MIELKHTVENILGDKPLLNENNDDNILQMVRKV
jgi:hypothetical protein